MLLLLPKDLIGEVTGRLPYPDAISLGLTCKSFVYLTEEAYWSSRNNNRPPSEKLKDPLTWKGRAALEAAQQGYIFRGAENFLSFLQCWKGAYKKMDDDLLLYFIRVYQENPWLYPVLELTYSEEDEDNIDMDYTSGYPQNIISKYYPLLLTIAIVDSSEDTFVALWNEGMYTSISSEDTLYYYLQARRRGLEKAREVIIGSIPSYSRSTLLYYSLYTQDMELFLDLLPYITNRTHQEIYCLLDSYPWPEIEPYLEPFKPGYRTSISPVDITIHVKEAPRYIPEITEESKHPSGAGRILVMGERQEVREMLSNLTEDNAECIQYYFPCDELTTQELYEKYTRFTVPSYKNKNYSLEKKLPEIKEESYNVGKKKFIFQ